MTLAAAVTPLTAIYPEPLYDTPPGNPAAQTGMDLFTPPTGLLGTAAVAMGGWTEDAQPGDDITITGAAMGLNFFPAFWGQSSALDATYIADPLQSLSLTTPSNIASWTVPASLPFGTGIMMLPSTGAGFGRPVILNKTRCYWVNSNITGFFNCPVDATNIVGVHGVNMTKPLSSSSTVSVQTGTAIFTVAAGLNISAGQAIYAMPRNGRGNSMAGTVVSYSGTTLSTTFASAVGSGSFSTWNLYTTGYTWIRLACAGQSAFVTATSANPYRVQFQLPASIGSHTLVNGDSVEVWVTSSAGGNKLGWSKCPQNIQVTNLAAEGLDFPSTPTATLTRSGDTTGATDAGAIQGTINGASGSIRIVLGPGIWYLNSVINMGAFGTNGCSIEGAGQGSNPAVDTIIVPASSKAAGYLFASTNSTWVSRLKNLRVDLTGSNMTYANNVQSACFAVAHLVNCDIIAPGVSCNVLGPGGSNNYHALVTGCNLKGGGYPTGTQGGSPFFISQGLSLYMDSTNVYAGGSVSVSNAVDSCLNIWNTHDVSVTNCTFQDFGSDLSLGRVGQHNGRLYNIYYDGITSTFTGPGTNNGEQFFFEASSGVLVRQQAVSIVTGAVTVVTLTDVSSLPDNTGLGFQRFPVWVQSGKGAGQKALVVSRTGTAITLDRPWLVDLDTTSEVVVGDAVCALVIHNSRLSGVAANLASCLANLYMGAFDCTLDNIYCTGTVYGMQSWPNNATVGGATAFYGHFFNVIKNIGFASIGTALRLAAGATPSIPVFIGEIYRNIFADIMDQAIFVAGAQGDHIPISNSSFSHAKKGIVGNVSISGRAGRLLLSNTGISCDGASTGAASQGVDPSTLGPPDVNVVMKRGSFVGHAGATGPLAFANNNLPP